MSAVARFELDYIGGRSAEIQLRLPLWVAFRRKTGQFRRATLHHLHTSPSIELEADILTQRKKGRHRASPFHYG
jgi:hypothetical protein